MLRPTNRIPCAPAALSGEMDASQAVAPLSAALSPLGEEAAAFGACFPGGHHRGPRFNGNVSLDAKVRDGAVDIDFRLKGTFSKRKPPQE